jgi:hypothetical protein
MNGVLARQSQCAYFIVPVCKNCIHFVSKGSIFYDMCSKFKTKAIIARSDPAKCGPDGSHFEFKGWLK